MPQNKIKSEHYIATTFTYALICQNKWFKGVHTNLTGLGVGGTGHCPGSTSANVATNSLELILFVTFYANGSNL